jgi:hypothetical protein
VGWGYGDVILWCYRRGVIPVRVVEDTERALVVWQAPDTNYLQAMPADGRDFRDRPLRERFTMERTFQIVPWWGDGTLRIAQPGTAHSSWLFRSPDRSGTYLGWYGNLEAPLRRSDVGVHAIDHVLDVFMDAAGNVMWKDEDELEAAVEVGRFDAQEAVEIRAEGERVFAAMQRRDWPYDGSWLDWKPDPAWTVPELAEEWTALEGQPGYDLFQEFN